MAEKPAGTKLRTGYTTGACAAAAAKAATLALLRQQGMPSVDLTLPIGQKATFVLERCTWAADRAACSVIKNGGDDPDATHGAEIVAEVFWSPELGVHIEGGTGVGVVTKPGVGLPVGGPAINPVPCRMIRQGVAEVMDGFAEGQGLRVVISVPKGEEIARKTLNARLGIIGGISILGTTGLVIPFSTAAWRASVLQAIDVAAAGGCTHVVLTTGGRSEKYLMRLLPHLPEEAFVEMGDFVGHALRHCVKRGIGRVTIGGMIGKLTKMAAGKVQTHAAGSQVDTAFLARIAAEAGAPPQVCRQIAANTTARFFSEVIGELGLEVAHTRICELVCRHLRSYIKDASAIECVMTDFDHGYVLGRFAIE